MLLLQSLEQPARQCCFCNKCGKKDIESSAPASTKRTKPLTKYILGPGTEYVKRRIPTQSGPTPMDTAEIGTSPMMDNNCYCLVLCAFLPLQTNEPTTCVFIHCIIVRSSDHALPFMDQLVPPPCPEQQISEENGSSEITDEIKITDQDLLQVSSHLTHDQLRKLYLSLGLQLTAVEKAERKANTNDEDLKAVEVLRLWRQINGMKATREEIVKALKMCHNMEAVAVLERQWDIVC